MNRRLRDRLLRMLRVRPEPATFDGARVLRVFRAAPGYYRYRLVLWTLQQLGAVLGLIGSLAVIYGIQRGITSPTVVTLLRGAELFAWLAFLVQLPFGYALLRLDFELRWYILSDRSLRIREGIVTVREKTMTFANVQEISIRQNPLQRLLGIADVKVRSAGGGAGSGGGGGEGKVGESMHEAYFRGVDDAEEIRAAVRERVRLHRDSGLGDADDPSPLPAAEEPEVLRAARDLRDEMQALRRSLAPAPEAMP